MLLVPSFVWQVLGKPFSRCRSRLSDWLMLLMRKPNSRKMHSRLPLPPIKGKVEFENVSFRFNPHAAPVVKVGQFQHRFRQIHRHRWSERQWQEHDHEIASSSLQPGRRGDSHR